ncbi:MAG: PBP1A family penicillin-binding protein [Coriobacteriales bacterium]|jgi:penicillin-binding protein 1A|nr:PBP1A family penicillin-binding protein [Coriobacteriales bacterium]
MSSRKKRAKQEPKRHIIPFVFILVVAVLVGLVGFSTAGAYALVQTWLVGVPSIDELDGFEFARKTRVYASDGVTLLGEFYDENREPVTADQVSPHVFNATVDVEDERFWGHRGIDYYGIARAAVNDLMGGDLQGASTITQQLVRQTILQEEATESTFRRKVREAYLAMELEKKYSKEDVLMMYLNFVNYGDGALGIQAAAQHYFSKNASELSIPEAALLCGIPQSPTYNNPVEYPDNARRRRNIVLDRMYVNGHLTEQELEEYKASDLNLNVRNVSMDGIYLQPYFTSYVREELSRMQREGKIGKVFGGGLTIYTTIDLSMQAYAEEICATKEQELIESSNDSDIEVGLTCVDPNNGYIKVMRAGKDYYADQWSTAWQMKNQAGSTFKVFGLVTAIEQGYSPSTEVSGKALTLNYGGGQVWKPENYQGQEMGIMSLAQATWSSSNLAYARVAREVGADAIQETAIRMGIKSVDPQYATSPAEKTDLEGVGPSIVLGAYGVNTMEMASAFGVLATGGVRHEPTSITKIVNYEGTVIYDHESNAEGVRVLTPEVAFATNQVLKGVVTGGTATSARLGWQVAAGKTGTADEYTDSWFVGYTPQLSTAVWIGSRERPHYIANNVGGANCCPVWRQFMQNALDGYEAQDFPWASNPPYNSKATFMSAAEKKEEEDEKKKKEEEEEEERKKQEEEEAKNNPPAGGGGTGGGTNPGGGTGGGTNPGGGTGGGTNPGDGTGGGGTGGGGTGGGTGGGGTGGGTNPGGGGGTGGGTGGGGSGSGSG